MQQITFNCQNCGQCCGPIPVTKYELNQIKQYMDSKSPQELGRVRKQKRDMLTCIFRDTEYNKCFIYGVRPTICRLQGLYEGLACPHQPEFATKGRGEGAAKLADDNIVGVLGLTVGWKEILEREAR